MTREDCIEYAKRMIVDSIYREARVEGINVTFPETSKIYEGGVIDSLTYDDITKIVNLKHAWAFLFDSLDYPFDIRYMRQNECNHRVKSDQECRYDKENTSQDIRNIVAAWNPFRVFCRG